MKIDLSYAKAGGCILISLCRWIPAKQLCFTDIQERADMTVMSSLFQILYWKIKKNPMIIYNKK